MTVADLVESYVTALEGDDALRDLFRAVDALIARDASVAWWAVEN